MGNRMEDRHKARPNDLFRPRVMCLCDSVQHVASSFACHQWELGNEGNSIALAINASKTQRGPEYVVDKPRCRRGRSLLKLPAKALRKCEGVASWVHGLGPGPFHPPLVAIKNTQCLCGK
jgi:hypothetical protein